MKRRSNIPVNTELKNELKKFLIDNSHLGTLSEFTEAAIIEKLNKFQIFNDKKVIDKKGHLELHLSEAR